MSKKGSLEKPRYTDWVVWFAWYPVSLGQNYTWLKKVERCKVTQHFADADRNEIKSWYIYRRIL